MAIGNTPRRETNISVEANKSFIFGIWFKTTDETPVDLTGSTVRFVATELNSTREVLSKDGAQWVDNAAVTHFEFQAEDLALTPATYSYDVTLYAPSGYSTPLLKGDLEVGSNTDVDTSNVFPTGIGTGMDVTVTLGDLNLVEITVERVDGLFQLVQDMIEDFRNELVIHTNTVTGLKNAAHSSAQNAAFSANELRTWLNNVQFPFWKGTQAEYDAIPVKNPDGLYLIVAG